MFGMFHGTININLSVFNTNIFFSSISLVSSHNIIITEEKIIPNIFYTKKLELTSVLILEMCIGVVTNREGNDPLWLDSYTSMTYSMCWTTLTGSVMSSISTVSWCWPDIMRLQRCIKVSSFINFLSWYIQFIFYIQSISD
jgi:hypothetical protein